MGVVSGARVAWWIAGLARGSMGIHARALLDSHGRTQASKSAARLNKVLIKKHGRTLYPAHIAALRRALEAKGINVSRISEIVLDFNPSVSKDKVSVVGVKLDASEYVRFDVPLQAHFKGNPAGPVAQRLGVQTSAREAAREAANVISYPVRYLLNIE
ncbi:MAG: hypothetical protein HQ596_04610 [Candidatus Saganbacteria bacterium]|nr:hypothetical protein [Candidatus Saganbacteria bacterium]